MPVKSAITSSYSHDCPNEKILSNKNFIVAECEADKEYFEKLNQLRIELKQLKEGTHSEFCKASKCVENWLSEQKVRIQILHENTIDEVHSEYEREIEICNRECSLEKRRIQEYLISVCEDLKRRLEHDVKNIELTSNGDILDLKPTVTRKLRRRAPEASYSGYTKLGFLGDAFSYMSPWSIPILSSGVNALGSTNSGPPVSCAAQCVPKCELEPVQDSTLFHLQTPPPAIYPSNLFGSLSVNVDAGNLVSHLFAPLTCAENNIFAAYGAPFMSPPNETCIPVGVLAQTTAGSCAALAVAPSPTNYLASTLSLSATAPVNVGALPSMQTASAKRRKHQNMQPFTQLALLIPENDIYSDLTLIHRACGKIPGASCLRKHTGSLPSTNSSTPLNGEVESYSVYKEGTTSEGLVSRRKDMSDRGTPHSPASVPSIWIDDGRLYCGQICFQQGASVVIEGREGSGHNCSGIIAAVGVQDVSIRRNSDHGIFRVTVQQLKSGRFTIWPSKRG